jgi:hypothetical protein
MDDKKIWVSDGKEWYNLFPPTESQQRFKTPDDSTEPFLLKNLLSKFIKNSLKV